MPHQRLLLKLKDYGVGDEVLNWIEHSLLGTRRRVRVTGSSNWSAVMSAVPQGSALGPLLSICHINDMPEIVTSVIYLYADDTKMFRQLKDESGSLALQNDLDLMLVMQGKAHW